MHRRIIGTRRWTDIALIFASTAAISVGAQGLRLVENGSSDYAIVRAQDPSPSVAYAAEELQSFTEQMTGMQLPIIGDEGPLPEKAILVGMTRYTSRVLGQAPDLSGLGTDGFRLVTASPHVCIVGSNVRGALYGVYELLERHGGCRWYSSFHSVIPKRTTWEIPSLDDTQIPAFTMREPFWFDMFDGDFAARSRANGNRMQVEEKHGGKIRFGGGLFVHTFFRLMPPSEFFKDHPEYYSEIEGKRVADHTQLCLTNPDVVRICSERLLERIRSDPGAKLYSLSQNDWRGYCTCPKCREIDEREGSPSGTLIHFVNQVAENVEKEFPDVWIETLAYQYTRHPPKTLKPRHNVVPRLCTIECDFSVPLDVSTYPQNVTFVDDIKGWSAITDKLYVWDYTTNFGHYIGPHPNFNCLQGNAKFFRDHSVVGLFEQGAYQGRHAEFAELRAWILAKLLWNPDQPIGPLYDDFFKGYYGAAAGPIRTYFDELQDLVAADEHVLRIWSPMTSAWYTDEFFAKSAARWQEAQDLVRDDPQRLYNVRMGAMPVIYARLQRLPKENTTYEWHDGGMRPTAVSAERLALATDLLIRLEEGKNVRTSESMDRQRAFLAGLRGSTTGYDGVEIEGGSVKAAVVPEFGGRICSLQVQGSPDFLCADQGGIETVPISRDVLVSETTPYVLKNRTENSGEVQRVVRRRYVFNRAVTATPDGLAVTSTIASSQVTDQPFSPVIRASLSLGNASVVAVRIGKAPWQLIRVPETQVLAMERVKADKFSGKTLIVASPVTGRAVSMALPKADIDRILITCDTSIPCVRVIALLSRLTLPGNEKTEFSTCFMPLPAAPDLPSPGAVPERHRPFTIVGEDLLISIGKRGTWGDYVSDPDTLDGSAAKLYNTHYEWCMQWRFDPSWCEPDTRYKLRVRVRVDKTDRTGEAFWAGVYDYGRKTSCGQIQPTTSDVSDEYAWYDVTEWIPGDNQYIWIGPGRFDKKGGAESAIGAVYVDRFELVKVVDAQ